MAFSITTRSTKSLAISISLFAVASCVSTPSPNYAPITRLVSFPAVGTESTASLGEDLLHQGIYTETDGINFQSVNNIKGYKLSAGFYPQIAEDDNYTYHSFNFRKSHDESGYIMESRDIIGLPVGIPQSIRASKLRQEVCVIAGGIVRPSCDTEHAFTRGRRPALSPRDFQQTLIYSGRVGDRVKVGYREISGSYARPAFSNEAEYDLSVSSEIAYRGARLKILSADNLKIRYVVLSHFHD